MATDRFFKFSLFWVTMVGCIANGQQLVPAGIPAKTIVPPTFEPLPWQTDTCLGHGETLAFERTPEGLLVNLPQSLSPDIAYSVKILPLSAAAL
jgi:hypothetical protein